MGHPVQAGDLLTIELHLFDKVAEFPEVFVGLSGEANDQGGAQSNVRNFSAEFCYE